MDYGPIPLKGMDPKHLDYDNKSQNLLETLTPFLLLHKEKEKEDKRG